MHLQDELIQRGFLKQCTNEKVFDIYEKGGQTFYIGMDPTADSLHLGNFVGFMHAIQYMKRGNKLIFLIGGATGMIGDPGGKNSERTFLDKEILKQNVSAITTQVKSILEHLEKLSGEKFNIEVVNNIDFYKGLEFLDFLRDVGKYITVNQMMKKETVKRRLTEKDQSISYTEFSYMLIQAYDFYKFFTQNNCLLQIAGSDQRGNVVTGIELIRKKTEKEAYGITTNLVLDSSGKKFGKSEGNALRLNPEKNNPLVIYQYFMNTSDDDVEKYLRLFTLLSFEKIIQIIDVHLKDTSLRHGQSQLAYYITQTIFGEEAAIYAKEITKILFQTSSDKRILALEKMNKKTIKALNKATGGKTTQEKEINFLDACILSGLTESRGETKKLIKQGSLYLKERKITDTNYEINEHDRINNILLLRKGKKSRASIRFDK